MKKKQSAIIFATGLALTLLAVLGIRSSNAEAATPALMIDPETGLPAGSLVFHVEDHTCIALPDHELECFCACSSGTCNAQVEILPLLPTSAVTTAVPSPPTRPTISNAPVPTPTPDQPLEPEQMPEQMPEPEPEPEPEPTSEPKPNPRDEAGKNRPKGNNGVGNGEDPQPPGDPRINDGEGTGPGNPGNKKGGGSSQRKKKD